MLAYGIVGIVNPNRINVPFKEAAWKIGREITVRHTSTECEVELEDM